MAAGREVNAPAAPPHPRARRAIGRLAGVGAVLLVEALLLRVAVPSSDGGARLPWDFGRAVLASFRFAFFGPEGTALLLAWLILDARLPPLLDAPAPWRRGMLILHGVLFAALAVGSRAWLRIDPPARGTAIAAAVGWHALLLALPVTLLAASAPSAALRDYGRQHGARLAGSCVAAAGASFALGLAERSYVRLVWPVVQEPTARLTGWLLGWSHPEARVYLRSDGATLAEPLVELGPVAATIGSSCAAATALVYSLLVVALAAWSARARLRMARVPLALLLALGGVFVLNAVRMWLIVLVAHHQDAEFAFGPFHEHSGVVLFGLHLVGCVLWLPRFLLAPGIPR